MILAETQKSSQFLERVAEAPLLVDTQSLSVRVSATRQSYPLSSIEVARWLRILAERPNAWVSSADLGELDVELSGQRVERLRKHLHRSIAKLVEVKRGKGARLVFGARSK